MIDGRWSRVKKKQAGVAGKARSVEAAQLHVFCKRKDGSTEHRVCRVCTVCTVDPYSRKG